jgi:hypothetical protein
MEYIKRLNKLTKKIKKEVKKNEQKNVGEKRVNNHNQFNLPNEVSNFFFYFYFVIMVIFLSTHRSRRSGIFSISIVASHQERGRGSDPPKISFYVGD